MNPKPFSWSYSQLKNFELCPERYNHYSVIKDVIEDESAELRAGKDLHLAFEHRLKDNTPLPLEYARFEDTLSRILAAPGKTWGEQKLALTSTFAPCEFFGRGAWFRTVVDCAKVQRDVVHLFDWKTGRQKPDQTQLKLMSLAIFAHYSSVKRVKASLVFVAENAIDSGEFKRDDVTALWAEILPRVKRMKDARESGVYERRPSGICKKWCLVTSCPFHGKGV